MFFKTGRGIFAKKYRVHYDYKESYEHAKDAYRAGTRVKLVYPFIATDTDYTFTVKGEDGCAVPLQQAFFGEIVFIMPEQDVWVQTTCRNSMVREV